MRCLWIPFESSTSWWIAYAFELVQFRLHVYALLLCTVSNILFSKPDFWKTDQIQTVELEYNYELRNLLQLQSVLYLYSNMQHN